MKIIVTVRTRNEAERIERFVMSYQWADKILIADGGSDDDTMTRCQNLPKTEVREFLDRVPSDDGKVWRNPHDKHIQSLIDWAEKEEGADWIIFDDCDSIPNYLVKEQGRDLFYIKKDLIFINRVYIYKDDRYFDKLGRSLGKWTPSIWAWRSNKGVKAIGRTGWDHTIRIPQLPYKNIDPPYCLLHYFYPNDGFMQKKLDFYRHMRPGILDPKDYGGDLLSLEDWMRE